MLHVIAKYSKGLIICQMMLAFGAMAYLYNITAMMSPEEAKYTRVEYERRFLVSPLVNWRSLVETCSKRLEDKYLQSTRLRLRLATDSESGRQVIKLTKKAASNSPYFCTISRILLSPGEYMRLSELAGWTLKKTRYYHRYQGRLFSVDVFEGELEGLILCETEANSLDELMRVEPPAFVKQEVTADEFFTGGKLCQLTREDLQRKLAAMA